MPQKGPLVVATFASPTEAEMARGLLESNGISARLRDAGLVGVHPLLSNAVGGVKVVVPAEDAGRALEILASPDLDPVDPDAGRPPPPLQLVDAADPATSDADALASRALNAAGIGLLVFPPLLHLWSAWLLLRAFGSPALLGPLGRKHALLALAIDALVFTAAAAIVLHLAAHR